MLLVTNGFYLLSHRGLSRDLHLERPCVPLAASFYFCGPSWSPFLGRHRVTQAPAQASESGILPGLLPLAPSLLLAISISYPLNTVLAPRLSFLQTDETFGMTLTFVPLGFRTCCASLPRDGPFTGPTLCGRGGPEQVIAFSRLGCGRL